MDSYYSIFDNYKDPFARFTVPFRLGDSGSQVSKLQRGLREAGNKILQHEYSMVSDTGTYDQNTESAVRCLQRDWSLSPDGIADAKTLQALTLARAPLGRFHDWSLAHNTRVQFILSTMGYIPNYETPLPPSSFKMSQAGKEMLFYNEATYGKDTACLHYPGNPSDPFNQSGVTLGPGYDMGEREKETIHDDLVSIGIDELTASKVAKDVPKLYGDDASKYALKYGKSSQEPLIQLSNKQQIMLQDKYLPPYEKLVKKLVVVPLLQREFDALVSFVVDPIRSFTEVSNHLNRDEVSAALTTILDRVPSRKSSIALGLMNRRQREVEFFVSGRYNK